MPLILALVVWAASAAVLAPILFFGAIILAGPHSSMLPSIVQPAVLGLCWLLFVIAPVWAARVAWVRAVARRVQHHDG